MSNNSPCRHREAQPKQSGSAFELANALPELLRRPRLLAMTALGAGAILPSLAHGHPGHDAPLFHTHEWEIGLALVGLIVGIGFAIRAWRSRK